MKFRFVLFLLTAISGFILWTILPVDAPLPDSSRLKEDFDGPKEFADFHRAIRTPDGATKPEYKNGYLIQEKQKALAVAKSRKRTLARTQSNGVLAWTERGPSNVPGRTRGLIVDPADPNKNTWLAGSAAGGVWKTTNGGVSWTLLTPDLQNLATTVLAMAPSNPNTIYMGTGEGFGNLDGVKGNGMFKSTDRGLTWNYLPATSSFDDVNRAIVDPNNENIVVVAANDGIYRTTTGGTSWTKVSPRTFIQDIKAKPGNFSIQYATQNSVGVLKSIDSGVTWNESTAGLTAQGRIEIDVSPVNPNKIFASVENNDNAKMYVSSNEGALWNEVSIRFNNAEFDFLGGQGWYDNTIACDPFNENVVYFGGVGLFRTQLQGTSATSIKTYTITNNTSFISLTNFGASQIGGTLDADNTSSKSVVLKFGPARSQKAHRFTVPSNGGPAMDGGASIPDAQYSYNNYVDIPFEAWEVDANGNDVRQLMVSFRDQQRDGSFNLNPPDGGAQLSSREYVYVHNITYNSSSPASSITTPATAGHTRDRMYFFWPVLAAGGIWNPPNLPVSEFKITVAETQVINATTITVADVYGEFDRKNEFNTFGVDLHPDQHNLVMIPMSSSTYKILNANDGGLFISNTSATPGINQGDWSMRGNTYNTSQFYGADKRPGFEEYFGGMQDNGTWKSRSSESASASSQYIFNLGGDGFEVIWHNLDGKKLIGGSQFNGFSRSTDGGLTWTNATNGLSGNAPFVSKLANSRHHPERIYTLTSSGVFRSENFGQSWTLSPISNRWGQSSLMDVEVSQANSKIVWAGSGMSSTRSIHVSTDAGVTFNVTQNYTLKALGGITKLASHPTEPNTAYALFSFSGLPKILRTTDLGQSWQDISGFDGVTGDPSTRGFPNVAVYCLYVHPNDPNIIWAGTEIGIVESLDNGLTWNIVDDFPNVSVWDMKGLDDEIIIATHGRGIWTATMSDPQISLANPAILAAGTAPNSDLALKIKLEEVFDSTEVYVNATKITKLPARSAGEYILRLKGIVSGTTRIHLISYKNSAPIHSAIKEMTHLSLPSVQTQYFNHFVNGSSLVLDKMNVSAFGVSNSSLQSFHNYQNNTEATALLRQPIKVNESGSFIYSDVALVEPGTSGSVFGQPEFKDYVVVEGTKDGLQWMPLENGYDARRDNRWVAAINSNTAGNPSMFLENTLDLKSVFSVGDTLLFRFRLFSDVTTNYWGWAIDNLYIQQIPTEARNEIIRNLAVYPNPSDGPVKIAFTLLEPSPVEIKIFDLSGKQVSQVAFQALSGRQERTVDLNHQGLYLVKVKSLWEERTVKIVVKK
jgi:photosystem II stability/assembly factor-like uncharacterized protein